MGKYNLKEMNKILVEKIKSDEKIIEIFIQDCIKVGVDPREAIKRANIAKSTIENYRRKQPKQFDNLAAMYKAKDELEAMQKEVEKVKKKYDDKSE